MPTTVNVQRGRVRRPLICLLIAIAASAMLTAVRIRIHAGDGFAAEYFGNARWARPATFSAIDRRLGTTTLSDRWSDALPSAFSVRWVGYVAVDVPGTYRCATTSDDGSRISIDNILVVDNGGPHGPLTRSGSIALARGSHLLVIEYAQEGGDFSFSWGCSRETDRAAAARAIDDWTISTRPVAYRTALAGRSVDVLRHVAMLAAIVSIAWLGAATGFLRSTGIARHPRLATAVLFVVLALLETWPLATDLVHLSRNDNADTVLNEWVLAWIAHQAPRHPLHLFDANIFYPERDTLGYSEMLLVQSAMAAPLLWSGASPVLAYNVTLMAGLALSGWAMCLVVARWTGDWTAGIASGIIAAFNGNTLTRLPHLQTQHTEFLPLALLALDTLLRQPSVRAALKLALWFTLQALTSYYLMVIAGFGLAAAALSRGELWRRCTAARVLQTLAIAAIVTIAALTPVLIGYWHVYHSQGFTRPIASLIPAEWRDYVASGSHTNEYLFHRWYGRFGLAPGLAAALLACVAIATGTVVTDPRCRMCAALGLCGLVLSFGATVPGYATLYSVIVPLHGIRAVARFGYLFIAGIAVMAGFGAATIRRFFAPGAMRVALSVGLALLLVADSIAAPLEFVRVGGVPPIYAHPPANAIVAELPMPFAIADNARFMLHSTLRWYRLINGYSGFVPSSYFDHYEALQDFPSAHAIDALRSAGVTHIFVNLRELGPDRVQQLHAATGLTQVDEFGAIALYILEAAPQ
jgi:hypothetical protein